MSAFLDTRPGARCRIPRPCTVPGCGELVTSGKCGQHAAIADRARGSSTVRGYDAAFRKLRVLCFERDGWRCVDCGWEPDSVRILREAGMSRPPIAVLLEELRVAFRAGRRHLHADHEIPVVQRPELRLSLDNLRTRCNKCHSAKTVREDGGFGRV
jgi:5-methylcytosine-specific restriction endonuclease McrA